MRTAIDVITYMYLLGDQQGFLKVWGTELELLERQNFQGWVGAVSDLASSQVGQSGYKGI